MPGTAEIRVAVPDDAPRLLPLLRATAPYAIWTEASLRSRIDRRPPGLPAWRRLVAERDDEVVGYAAATPFASAEGLWEAWVAVAGPFRRRGLGTRLLEAATAYVHAHAGRRVEIWAHDEGGAAFARARGFEPGRSELGLVLEPGPRGIAVPGTPPGIDVVPLGTVADREAELHAVFAEAVSDIPGEVAEGIPLDRFVAVVLSEPDLDREASTVVLERGRPVGLSFLYADREGGVAVSSMTGTLRSHRRRGLARLAKATALRRAAELGIRRFVTSSDSENVAMEALNRSLGYAPLVTYVQLVRDL